MPSVSQGAELEQLQEELQIEQTKLELSALRAQARLADYESSIVQESFNQPIDPREQFYDEPGFYPIASQVNAPYFMTQVDDRENGQFRPLFETEHDLNVIRAQTNRVIWFDEIGISALDSLKSYIFQGGLKYLPTTLRDDMQPVVDEAKELIEHILHINEYRTGVAHQYHDRSRADGEVLTELVWRDDAVWLDREPQHLTEPDLKSQQDLEAWPRIANNYAGPSDWKFGVHTPAGESHNPIGYHFVYDKEGRDWDYVPAERLVHYKRNVYRTVKRGISDFFPVIRDLERDSKLCEHMALGAALQAAIPWIVQYPEGARTASIQTAVAASADYKRSINRESGTVDRVVNKVRGGSIPHMKKGTEYIEGPLAKGAPFYIQISQHIRRTIGVRFSIPEFMISGDASNGNYSSTNITHDAFVRARQDDQKSFGSHGVDLLWKSLRMYHQRGMFAADYTWDEIKRWMRINAEGTDPSTKSPLEKRQALEIEVQNGWTSDETAATECGRHYEEEKAKGAKKQASPNMRAEQQMSGNGPADDTDEEEEISKDVREAWHGGY